MAAKTKVSTVMRQAAAGLAQSLALRIPSIRRLHASRNTLLVEREELVRQVAAREPPTADRGSVFYHYHTCFDAEALIRRHAATDLRPDPLHLTNFLGVRIDPKFMPGVLTGRAGEIEAIPIPANWHADIAEWAAALRAVELARGSFTVIELGCGWACWLNNTGVAAHRCGLDVHLIGIEADGGHIGFAREACTTNGFRADQVSLHHGVAAANRGTALFPKADPGMNWGGEPTFGATPEQCEAAAQNGSHDVVPMIPLAEIVASHSRIDLLHIDIQGSEADLVAECLTTLDEKIAYIVIGTHSRQIEGRLLETLLGAGWRLEIERPAIVTLNDGAPVVIVDGVQGWRNQKLLPAD